VIDLVMVHTGTKIPKHLNDNLSRLTHSYNISLIINEKLIDLIELKYSLHIVPTESLADSQYNNYALQNYDFNSMDGFWHRASSRFILLSLYAKKYNSESFWHIENDVALFSDLKRANEILSTSPTQSTQIALVMDSINRCIPAIMWFRDKNSTNKLSDFIYNNNHTNDMDNLAKYFHSNRNTTCNLPIVSCDIKDDHIKYNNRIDEFESVFDGASCGQYLCGIDPIHCGDLDSRGFINETCIFNPQSLNVGWHKGKPYMDCTPINNLHIHSKKFNLIGGT
jgi:hypothetical protein